MGGHVTARVRLGEGFDWNRVSWAAPDQPQPTACSVCDAPIGMEELPLLLFTEQSWCAALCDGCRRRWLRLG